MSYNPPIHHHVDVKQQNLTQKAMFSTWQPVVLGDLNADCNYASYDQRVAAKDYLTTNTTYAWVINDNADTTVKTTTDCAYDRSFVLGFRS